MDAKLQWPAFNSYVAEDRPDTAPVILAEGVTAIGFLSGNLHLRLEVLVHELAGPNTRQVESKRRAVCHLRLTLPCAEDVKNAIGELQKAIAATPGNA